MFVQEYYRTTLSYSWFENTQILLAYGKDYKN